MGVKRLLLFLMLLFPAALHAANTGTEVVQQTDTQVLVRQHPRTGREYVAIVKSGPGQTRMERVPVSKTRFHPDYRMLDPKLKSGAIPYEGPVSDRKKVYIFAAAVAAVGAAGGTAIIAGAPAATGAGAAGGAGGYAAAGTAVGAGTLSTSILNTRPDPDKDKIEQGSESRQVLVKDTP